MYGLLQKGYVGDYLAGEPSGMSRRVIAS